jgi:methionyl-tRNA formyltransferase
MISVARTPITASDTTATLHDKLAVQGAQLIVAALETLERDARLPATPQPEAGVTYAEKIGKHEAALDWRRPAQALARQVRAFDPFPGGVATLGDGTVFKIWAAEPCEDATHAAHAEPGTIVDVGSDGVVVACGTGALRLTQLQKPGGKRLPAREFLAGAPLDRGQRLSMPPDTTSGR